MSSKKKAFTLGNIKKEEAELFKKAVKVDTDSSKKQQKQKHTSQDKNQAMNVNSLKQHANSLKQHADSQKQNANRPKQNKVDNQQARMPSAPPPKGRDDADLFKQYMQDMKGIKPMEKRNQSEAYGLNSNKSDLSYQRQKAEKFTDSPADELSDYIREPVNSEQQLSYYRPGLQLRVFDKLKSGQLDIEAVVDLHGRTVEEARASLSRFLRHCYLNNRKCIKIIHGKSASDEGKFPLIKTLVNTWLPQLDYVMAFCSALKNDGGTGASYVLLKQKKHKSS